MSKSLLQKRHHPEGVSLKEARQAALDRGDAERSSIRKQFTTLKVEDGTGETGGVLRPSDEQLERINRFTRTPKTADDVVVFETMSCNDMVDRDDDQFVTQCIKDFAALPEPYSSVGKSYMVGHDHTSLGKGRIFGVGTKSVDGTLFLTNEVYIPNTPQYQDFIENLDFGINWAVSVGVMLGKSECSIPGCDAQYFIMGMWCSNGHDKGYWYDPDSDETDNWGYPVPVEAGSKGAVRCIRQFSNPVDFYELSQVYLGAQYFAELSKDPELASVMKAASAPIVSISKQEAMRIDMPKHREPLRLRQARESGQKVTLEEGVFKWLEGNLVYIFDPEEDSEPSCIGAANEETLALFRDADDDADNEDDANDDEPETGDGDPEDDEESGDDKAPSAEDILQAAKAHKLPDATLVAFESLAKEGNLGLNEMFEVLAQQSEKVHEELQEQIKALTPKAEAGERYLKGLREDVISWYVKAHQEQEGKGVSTDLVESIVDKFQDDEDTLEKMIEEYRTIAQSKFPAAVRRSSEPDNPNNPQPLKSQGDEEAPDKTGRIATRLHGR